MRSCHIECQPNGCRHWKLRRQPMPHHLLRRWCCFEQRYHLSRCMYIIPAFIEFNFETILFALLGHDLTFRFW